MHFNDKGIIECKECRGRRIVPSKEHPGTIMEICPKCNGNGGQDWIDHAMGKRADEKRSLQYHISHENIHRLMHLIREEGMKLDQIITVSIQQEPIDDRWRYTINTKF